MVGVVGAHAGSTGAQPAIDPIGLEVVSVDAVRAPQEIPDDAAVAISDRGNVIAYEALDEAEATEPDGSPTSSNSGSRIWIRDRVEQTSRPVAEFASVAPGISADGCLVAYVVVRADDATAALTVVDRCAADRDLPLPIGTVLDTVAGSEVGAPSLSFDGSTIAWSTGNEIRRYQRPALGAPFDRTGSFDSATISTPDVVTGPTVDVSDDGNLIVYTAGPGTEPFAPTPANVYSWDAATPASEPELLSPTSTGAPGAAASTGPSISGDGSFVVFESVSGDLAAADGSTLVVPFVVGVDRVAQTAQVLVDDAARPVVSSDGFHVAYQRGGGLRVLSSDGVDVVDSGADELAAAEPSGPVAISQHGRWLMFASAADLSVDSPTVAVPVGTAAVWAADRSSSSLDVLDTTTTTTTNPPIGLESSTTTTSPTTTTQVPTDATVPAPTWPTTPIVERFPTSPGSFPRVVISTTVPRPRPSSPFVQSPRATTVQVLAASAAPVAFDPTVVNAGRRIQSLTLFNSTTRAITVSATTIDAAGPFTISSDLCAGVQLAPSASCVVDVQFAPVDLGVAAALASFRLSDGSVVTTSLSGEGVPQPTLDLVPAVAGAGQTVTVFGAGFPPGSVVEMNQPGVAESQPVVVDPDGTFAHVLVVLPNTPTGPLLLTVAGQPDLFADVDAELLVSSRGSTSDGAALRNGLGTSSRR